MTGSWPCHHFRLTAILRIRRHALFPVLEVAICDNEGHRTAHRAPESNSGDNPYLVLFDQHPAPAPITLLAAGQIVIDAAEVDIEAGWSSLNHRNQFGAVRFTGGQKTQH